MNATPQRFHGYSPGRGAKDDPEDKGRPEERLAHFSSGFLTNRSCGWKRNTTSWTVVVKSMA
jgi:hypothetical protein